MFVDAPELEPVEQETTDLKRILIIDDDEAQVSALSHRFEQNGFRTILAHRGQQGLELVKSKLPDLIILDLRLPDMLGFEVCKEITNSSQTCGIPVIIVSGMEDSEIVRRARTSGCTYYLRKPYDPNSLLVLVERAIDENESW